jgi:V/A-type H+-transporting ATPase subunit I
MLRPEAMQFATLYLLREDAPAAAHALAQSGAFVPEDAAAAQGTLPDLPGARFREIYHSARTRLEKLLTYCNLNFAQLAPPILKPVAEVDLARLDTWLGQAWTECSQHQEDVRRCEEQTRHYQALLKSLDAFAQLDIDLGMLRHGGRFLDLRVGFIATQETARLAAALTLAGYVLEVYRMEGGQSHCILAGSRGHEAEVLPLLSASGWHALDIPPEFVGRPETIRAHLSEGLASATSHHAQSCKLMAHSQEIHRTQLIEAAHILHNAAPHAELANLLHARGGLSVVNGWVAKRQIAALRSTLTDAITNRYLITLRDPLPEEMQRVPSWNRHPRWLQPFAALVKNYGVPRYGEIDPTPLFAVSFIAMFGMMFGDIGHGALILLAGLWLRPLAFARPMLVAAGVSSMLFGWAYGSLFGFEEIIHPLWLAPLSDPTRMLMVALYWGIGFILTATTLTIINRLAEGETTEAWFGARGVAGMVFYLGLIYAAYRMANGFGLGEVAAAWMLVPFAFILRHLWHAQHEPLGERILVVAVEALETALNYIANTLSFLRVAAFSLNHVALAVAVFALAHMMGNTGHWITVVLGNVFILVMEGGIVAIQVLRLEYYEGFSRFFQGTGKAYQPLQFASSITQSKNA